MNNSADAVFIGNYDDSIYGIFSGTTGWRFLFDHKNGRFGIDVANPKVPLSFPTVEGKKISLYPGVTGDAGMGVFPNEFRLHSDHSNADMTFGYDDYTNGFTERMRIKGSGNVGIGTNNPTTLLTVAANGKGITQQSLNAATQIGFYTTGTTAYVQTHTNTPMFFATNNGQVQMTLSTAGNFGIGTTTPQTKLDIATGRLRFTGSAGANAPPGIEFTNASGNALSGFVGQYDDNTLGLYGFGGSGWGFLWDVNDASLRLGTPQKATGYMLNVGGKIIAEEIRVLIQANWPDYVFEPDYKLRGLKDLEQYINQNKHLPGIPTAEEIKTDGHQLGDIQIKLLQKVEELTLYMIEADKKIKELQEHIITLEQKK